MTLYLLAFISSFTFIFLRAFQQLNVVRGNYILVLPTSMAMAACEVFTISAIVVNGWGWIVLAVGFGSGLGALLAMYVHKTYVEKKNG